MDSKPAKNKLLSKEIIIGVCVALSIAILIFGIDFLKGVNVFKSSNYYYATYDNVSGLAQSAPVHLNGFKVGQVREISYEYDNPGHIKVELSLDHQLRIPRGTKAVIATDMLGTSTVDLVLGNDGDFHNVGDELIGVTKGGLMSSLGDDLMPAVASILPKVDSLISSLATLASDPALKNSVQSLDVVMTDLKATSANLSKVMATMPGIAADAKTTMKNVGELSESARNIASDFTVVSGQLREARLDSTLRNINSLSASLAEISEKINGGDSSLGKLVNDPTFYNSVNSSVASLDSLLQDVKRNPKRYISIKLL